MCVCIHKCIVIIISFFGGILFLSILFSTDSLTLLIGFIKGRSIYIQGIMILYIKDILKLIS